LAGRFLWGSVFGDLGDLTVGIETRKEAGENECDWIAR